MENNVEQVMERLNEIISNSQGTGTILIQGSHMQKDVPTSTGGFQDLKLKTENELKITPDTESVKFVNFEHEVVKPTRMLKNGYICSNVELISAGREEILDSVELAYEDSDISSSYEISPILSISLILEDNFGKTYYTEQVFRKDMIDYIRSKVATHK